MDTAELATVEFWQSTQCHVIANPRDGVAMKEAAMIRKWVTDKDDLAGHILFSTSGSTGRGKWVALAKTALLSSAQTVNDHLGVDQGDKWLSALPEFHVGGMGIRARAYLASNQVIALRGKWNPQEYRAVMDQHEITFSSLVPTQLVDLVNLGLDSPESLRGLLVGGGRLEDAVYQKAVDLGWPILETYGMTETCSQLATAKPGSRQLHLLPGWQARLGDDSRLSVKGMALLTAYVNCEGEDCYVVDPKSDGWFETGDVVRLDDGLLVVEGRVDRCVKVLGELVNLSEVEKMIYQKLSELGEHAVKLAVVAVPDERKGNKLILCSDSSGATEAAVNAYHADCLPVARMDEMLELETLPYGLLGKVRYGELQEQVQATQL